MDLIDLCSDYIIILFLCWFDNKLDARKRRKRSGSLVLQKRKRRLLPFIPTEDSGRRLKQMGSLASALTTLHMKFSDDLTYMPGMAPKSANQSKYEDGGMQVEHLFFSVFPQEV